MASKGDFHVHTTFCDGRNTAEEMAEAALAAGMYGIGFSSHSPMPFECYWVIREERIRDYKAEIKRLKEKFAGRITILTGLELDLHSELPLDGLDYIISSTHFVKKDGQYLPVDESADRIIKDTDEHYGGDILAYTRDFYEQVSRLGDNGPAVIGHFDLVTKFNEGGRLFDESDPRYLTPAIEALEVLAAKDMVFEINTGAIYRGSRITPYPAEPLLRRIKELGGRVILSGDCHCADALCFKFDEARQIAADVGFTEIEKFPPIRK